MVVVNVHKDSCDALALSLGLNEPLHIPLYKFSYAKASELHDESNTHLRGIRATGPVGHNNSVDVIKRILHQLWILVVQPILDGVGYSVSTLGISAMLK